MQKMINKVSYMENRELKKIANEVRRGSITALYSGKAGHPGGSLSAADIITFLYFEEMRVNPADPDWKDRDRFVLSKGHTAPALYAAMAERGYFDREELKTCRHLGSRLQGHPSMRNLPGVDMSTGSLGQGVSAAVGIALAGKIDHADYRVYTMLGDGECEEGQVYEAAMFAAAKKLDNLVMIIDYNGLQIDGDIREVNDPTPFDTKFEAFNCHVMTINGHDFDEIRAAFKEARETKGQPTVIIARTIKGKDVSYMENQAEWHGKAPNDELYARAMSDLDAVAKTL